MSEAGSIANARGDIHTADGGKIITGVIYVTAAQALAASVFGWQPLPIRAEDGLLVRIERGTELCLTR
jgi:hypothetical protein